MHAIKSLVIVGGGTAGWMAAAFFAKRFTGCAMTITLVESTEIGTIGVGEATVPSMKMFLADLGIDEREFIQNTQATCKLGIDFNGWWQQDTAFFHPFAMFGAKIAHIPFHHYWAYLRAQGQAGPIDDYSLPAQMARANKFALPKDEALDIARFNYAYHFDAGSFANYLSRFAQTLGVKHIEARVTHVLKNADTGNISTLILNNGKEIEGDFFIDCSGFRALLIEENLHTGYQDWSHWLPCDRALALPCAHQGYIPPYTRALACTAGWQWRIPLQHRHGNGYVYSSHYISDDQALAELTQHMHAKPTADPRVIRFTTGMRNKCWNKNVFALGLSSGFLEPLESTSIYMVQTALATLFTYFPTTADNIALSTKVNKILAEHNEKLRDFIILHYHLNQRIGMDFWDACRAAPLPDSLSNRIEEFRATGNIRFNDLDFFQISSWLAMFSGFQLLPQYQHPKILHTNKTLIIQELQQMRNAIQRVVRELPEHHQFIAKNASLTNTAITAESG
ncbi:tryptophan halogenase family protein [Cellvibrio japonicus]|uniref:Tryptophan halogenase n=1 Tax=Cellvibrio japonicus (strain Ueda107) TaxID=498211 RepID=B3PG13_CELJU|nr:tryptophan halogenase family protein [Cellvibrio japonicus]ACE83694.1 tryptophan halogenase [Cellvibrio japonicus Ueda107]QEI13698.1 tryptophan 7-halogenase [Cellvibrio japonicus]QEI17272.1 tryptophan 7-halogenase [Cellvibrio japonicus]QEI20849.1 tryptophan 7-halogenase [Cellvibrio japonicus]